MINFKYYNYDKRVFVLGGEKMKRNLFSLIYNLLLISFCFSNIAYAGDVSMDALTGPLTEITQVLLVIAGGACVGKIIHIGIQYVMSSAADKSNAKMALLPWLVGTIICFGAAVIGPAIIGIFNTGNTNVLSY